MDTRERLIEATRGLLWERGYAATSPAAIRERAQAGQGSMYHHFRDKHDLAIAALGRTAGDMRGSIAASLHQPRALDALRAYVQHPREGLQGCPVGRMSYDADVVADPALAAPVQATFEWLLDRLAVLVRQAQCSGDLDPGLDPDSMAAVLAASVQGGYVLARATGDPGAFARATAGALQLLDRATPHEHP